MLYEKYDSIDAMPSVPGTVDSAVPALNVQCRVIFHMEAENRPFSLPDIELEDVSARDNMTLLY